MNYTFTNFQTTDSDMMCLHKHLSKAIVGDKNVLVARISEIFLKHYMNNGNPSF